MSSAKTLQRAPRIHPRGASSTATPSRSLSTSRRSIATLKARHTTSKWFAGRRFYGTVAVSHRPVSLSGGSVRAPRTLSAAGAIRGSSPCGFTLTLALRRQLPPFSSCSVWPTYSATCRSSRGRWRLMRIAEKTVTVQLYILYICLFVV